MSESLSDRIDERLRILGLSERAASLSAGASADLIRNIRTGKSREPRRSTLDALAKVLEVSTNWLAHGTDEAATPAETTSIVPSEVSFAGYPPQRTSPPRKDLPIRGTAAGSIIQNAGEGFVLHADVIGYTERPPSLDKILEAYAIMVVGDSMWPLHPPGATRIVNPLRPTAPGNSVIVLTRRWDDDPGQAYIKILERRTQTSVFLTQLNPNVRLEIPRQYVVGMHYVLDYEDLLK